MTRRYFVAELPAAGGLVVLSDEESRHAAQVMRVQPGEALELFDGRNRVSAAVVQTVTRRQVVCDAQPPRSQGREPMRCIVAAVAIPKGDRARALVEKLTELGVAELLPLVCHRSQWEPSEAALEKLRRGVVESCKQCGRNQLMQIRSPEHPAALWSQACWQSAERWIATPGSAPIGAAENAAQPAKTLVFAIGPEGGFTPQESEAAVAAGWRAVGLGPRIYRIETAAMVLAVWAAAGS